MDKFYELTETRKGHIKVNIDEFVLYRFLKESAFGFIKINNKPVFFRILDKTINAVSFKNIRDFAFDKIKIFLADKEYASEILNECYKIKVIKQGEAMKYILNEELSEVNIHILRMSYDEKYKTDFLRANFFEKLELNGFIRTTDVIGTYLRKNSLFYRNISHDKYIIVMHPDHLLKNTFADSRIYIAKYNTDEEIGKKQPMEIEGFVERINLNNFNILEQTINNYKTIKI